MRRLKCKLTFELHFSHYLPYISLASKMYFSNCPRRISPIRSEVIERVAQLVGGLWRLGGVPPVQPGLSLGDTRAPTLSQRSTGISFETTSTSSFSVQWISLETFLGICSLRDKLTDSFLESFQFCQQHVSIEIIRGLVHHILILILIII